MNTVDEATGRHRGFMLICRPARAPSILYTMSCQHKSWTATAMYLTEDVPGLLSLEEAKDVQELLAVIFSSAPMDLRDFINWVAEVRRQEEVPKTISEEEKERLAIKEEVLKQVQETELYKHVIRWLASKSCCKYIVLEKDSLTEIGSKLCCQGVQLLQGKVGSSDGMCCRITNLTLLKDNGDKPIAIISGNVITGSAEQGVDVLVPSQTARDGFCCYGSSNLYGKHPSIDDVLTVLLLALPPNTWSSIKDEKLRDEILSLASTDSLPLLLQDEVLHLRQQLSCLSIDLGDSPS